MPQSIVVQNSDGTFERWLPNTLKGLNLKEADLERAIVAYPKALILDPLELLVSEVKVYSQFALKGVQGMVVPDVVIFTDQGDVVLVEAKRAGNSELRGRAVIAQVVDYATNLSQTAERALVQLLSKDEYTSWEALCEGELSAQTAGVLARRIRDHLKHGEIHLVIACDEAPAQLADWVQASSNRNAMGFTLSVVEIQPMTNGHDIAWVPRVTVATEIIHRTVVRIEGNAAKVRVSNDSAQRVQTALKPKKRHQLHERMDATIEPISAALSIPREALLDELVQINVWAANRPWPLVHDALASALTEEDLPYLRGSRKDGRGWGCLGVDLVQAWTPSLFVGAYLDANDYKEPMLAPHSGGDFVVIVDLQREWDQGKDAMSRDPLFTQLRARLKQDAGDWDFADHLARKNPNRWHPIHLRRPLMRVLGDTENFEMRKQRWLAAAEAGIEVLLRGGELAALHRKFMAE